MPPASPLAASDRVFDPSWHRTSRDQQGEGGARRFCGSTTVTANSSGTRTGEIRYKAYGASRYTYGTTPTTYHFTGQREESTIGLYYYGARWYDPALGRFVQADSIIPNGAYPQDFNRYAYTRNNPVKFIDSSGHWVESAIDIVGIGLDIVEVKNNPSLVNIGLLALDVGALLLPAVPAVAGVISRGGKAAKVVATHGDEVIEAGKGVIKAVDKISDAANAADSVADTAKVVEGVKPGVKAFQVGQYDTLGKMQLPGDGLQLHHVPQGHSAGQVVPGYNYAKGPAIALPDTMHARIPNRSGTFSGTARDLVAQDLWNLKREGVPRKSLQELLDLSRDMYPGALER